RLRTAPRNPSRQHTAPMKVPIRAVSEHRWEHKPHHVVQGRQVTMDPTSHRPAFEAAGEPGDDLQIMRELARHCTRCDLYRHATHLVFGEGPPDVDVVLVGEQSGDKKDLAARPFVGPAALLLDRCLENAGIDRARCYVTNAVKRFKFTPRGKRRIHAKPNVSETRASHGGLRQNLGSFTHPWCWRSGRPRCFHSWGKEVR